MSSKILILAGDYADDFEIMVPFSILKMFGCEVHVICRGKNKGDFIKII